MISCGREVTGPENGVQGPRPRVGALAVDPQMPSLMSSVLGGSQVVPFERVRVLLRREDGAVAVDTIVLFPSAADSLALTLLVPLPLNAPAAGAPMSLTMAYINARGDTVFRGGPQGITVAPVGSGTASAPVAVPVRYDGVGRNAASVVIAPDTGTVLAGSSSTFSAQALDAQAQPITGTPLLFYTLDSARAAVTSASTGAVSWLPVRGTARIVAALPDGARADTAFITVTLPASQLVISSGDAQTAPLGTALGAPIVVRTLASDNVPVAGVVVTFAVLTGGGSLSVSTDTSDANGEVSTSWTLGPAFGVQTITATAAGLAGSPLTLSATATAGAPARLAVQSQPLAGVAGAPLAPAIVVGVEDAQGNVVTTFSGPVSISLPALADATLGGSTTVNAVAGLATFSDLTIDVAGAYDLIASSETLVPDTTAAINIAPAAATHLKFTASPAGGVAGAVLAPATTVVALDAFGNQATAFTGPVTLSLLGGAGTLAGTTTVNAVSGSASFGDLSVELIGDAYTLRAASGTLAADTSTAFGITPAAVAALTLVAGDLQTASVGTPLPGAIAVRAVDAFGNRVPGAVVNFSVLTGDGVALPASTSADSAGVASTNWTLGPLQGTQTLRAALDTLPAVTVEVSATATAGAATQLALIQQPVDSVAAGASITLEVEARDAFGNPVTIYAGTAGVDFSTNPTAAALGGTVTATFVAGRAVLTPSILVASPGYELVVTSGALTPVATAPFAVVAAGAAQFGIILGNNQSVEAGTAFPQVLQVLVRDVYGNPKIGHPTTWSENGVVTLGTVGTVLTDSLGIAQNTAVAATVAGPQSGGPSVTTSGHGSILIFEHTVTPGPALSLAYTSAAPGQQVAGAALPAQVVEARDAFGNVATGFTDTVRALALLGGPAQPQDSAFVSAVGGIATFTGFTILQAGSPYQLEFASGTLTTLTPPFDVVPAAPGVLVGLPGAPTSGTAGSATAPASFGVVVSDDFGNRISGVPVLFRIVDGTADTVTTATVVTDSIGQAEWSPVLPATAGEYTVVALVDGLSGSPATFNVTVTAAAAFSLEYVAGAGQIDTVGRQLPDSLRVRVRDAFGNGVPGVAVAWSGIGGTPSADTTFTAATGDATVAYTFGTIASAPSASASVTGLSGSPVSMTFIALAASPVALVLVSAPDSVESGIVAPPFVVQARDAFGNVVSWFTGDVTATPTDAPDPSFAGGTATRAAVAGVASFDDLVFGTPGGWILEFASGALTVGASVVVIPGPATSFTIVSGDGQTGFATAVLGQPLVVRLLDGLGNPVVGDTVIFSVTAGGGTLANGLTVDSAVTDANGDAQMTWTLGTDTTVTHLVEAAYPGFAPLQFSATATTLIASRVWSGDALNGSWTDAGNWVQGVAPTPGDSVLIPAGRPSYPTFADLSGSPVDVTRLTMEVGAALALDLSDLRVAGSLVVAAAGSITSTGGGVQLVGTGAHEVRGWVPLLEILSGAYVMTGDLSVDSDLSVSGGSLDVTTSALSVGRDLLTSASGALRMGAAAGVIVARHAVLEGSGGASQLSGGTLTVRGNFTAGGNFAPAASHAVLLDGIGLQTVSFSAPDGALGTTCFSSCFGRLVASKAPGDGGIAFATNAKATNDIFITADSVSAAGRTLIAPIALVLNSPVVSATKLVYADSLVLNASAAVDTLWAFSTGAPRPLVSVGTIPTRVVGNRTLTGAHAGAILVTSGALDIDGPASVGADLETALSGTIQMTDASDTLVVAGSVSISGDGSSTMTDGVLVIQGDFVQQSIGAFESAPAHRTVFAGSGSFSINFANPSFAPGQSQFGTLVLDHPSASSATLGSDVYASVLETRNGSAYTLGGANRRLVTRGATNVANVTFSGVQWEIQDTQPIVGPLSTLQFTAMDVTISQLRVLRGGGTVQLQSPTFGTVPSGGAYLEVEDTNAGDGDSLTVTVTSPIPEFHGGAIIQASGAQILGWPAAPSVWTLNSWTGAGGNALWSTAANWSQGRAPLPGDSVVIDLGGSYTVTLNTSATVTYLTMGDTGTPTFSHAAGGTLTVDSTAFFGPGTTVLVQNGSALAGEGDIFVFGDLQFVDGVMSGAGSTVLLEGSSASFGTGGSVLLDDRALLIGGTATMGTGGLFAANAPLLYVLSTGDFAFTNDKYVSIGAAAPSVFVDGTLRIAAGATDTVDLEWPISVSGSVEIQSGSLILWNTTALTSVNIAGGSQLYLRGESDLVGTTSVASGATLRLGSGGLGAGTPGEHRIFGSVVGAGTVRSISAVRVAFEGGLDIDSLEVQNGSTEFNSLTDTMFVAKGAYLGGGFIRGDGVWAIRSRFSTNTGNLNGAGTIAVLPGATFSLRTPTRGWVLDVGGTLQWGDWDLSFEQEPVSLQYASMLVRSGGVFDILHGTTTPRELFGTGSATPPHNLIQVLAGGTIRKSSGTGVSNIRPRVETAGLIEILSGSINVQGTCTNTGSVTGTGSLSGNCGAFP